MDSSNILPIILWVILLGGTAAILLGQRLKKRNYTGKTFTVDPNWFANSQMRYGEDETKKAYFFHYDKSFLTQGHLMEDRDHRVIYEAKLLYGDPVHGYEADFTNHLLAVTHHHNIGATKSTGVGDDTFTATVSSGFKFDGKNIWELLSSLGYQSRLVPHGLAYTIPVTRGGQSVGTIYSSNNGKNFFGCQGPIEPKMGGRGICVVECADRDLDAMFLVAMAYARTETSGDHFRDD